MKNGKGRNRTVDAGIFSPSLYLLSYLAIRLAAPIILDFRVLFVNPFKNSPPREWKTSAPDGGHSGELSAREDTYRPEFDRIRLIMLKIAALLPHTEVFGGVRRYIEIGNELVRRGHEFTLFTPSGEPPAWLPFRGRMRPFADLAGPTFDVGLCSEYSILDRFDLLRAGRKYFYFVLEGHRREREIVRRGLLLLGNSEGLCSRIERRYGVICRRAPGGVNGEIFHPLDPDSRPPRPPGEFRVLCYGRITKRRKGVPLVIKAVERLRRPHLGLKLVFFDSLVGADRRDPRPLIKTPVPYEFYLDLPQSRMAWLFGSADAFVSAEKRAGWANTAAEAMACRLPVVCTPSGTLDFALPEETALVVHIRRPFFIARALRRLIEDPALAVRLAEAGHKKIGEFTWQSLASRLEAYFRD
jgi:glycosyltransferase involved in cell wall biosynthesis